MLGRYENFPQNIHGLARFSYRASAKKVQWAVASALYRLSQGKFRLKEIGYSSPAECEVGFEFGVGEEVSFTFLDEGEVKRLELAIGKEVLAFLDFLCALRYHLFDGTDRRALKFDYYLLRFAFAGNSMEFFVSHERGPRRVDVEDLIVFLAERVRKELAERYSVFLKLESVRAV